jgi:hypothetical protein
MSISTNCELFAGEMGTPVVITMPRAGIFVPLRVPSVHAPLTRYTSKDPAEVSIN